jgi:hypothetical protein
LNWVGEGEQVDAFKPPLFRPLEQCLFVKGQPR